MSHDVEGINFVINFDYPQNSEDYIHRIGRTGRSQATGTSFALFTKQNSKQARDLIAVLQEANQEVSPKLQEMARFGGGGGGDGRRWGGRPGGGGNRRGGSGYGSGYGSGGGGFGGRRSDGGQRYGGGGGGMRSGGGGGGGYGANGSTSNGYQSGRTAHHRFD